MYNIHRASGVSINIHRFIVIIIVVMAAITAEDGIALPTVLCILLCDSI
jgi:hypothetical protein